VVKITGNPVTWDKLRDHMDSFVGTILQGTESLPAAGARLFTECLAFASGQLTKAEISGYTNSMDIYVTGPVI
jgi:altronate dehydratase large subunit